jgi:hypothetical protein
MSTREENNQTEIYTRGAEQARTALKKAERLRDERFKVEAEKKAQRRAQQAPTTPVISNE